MRREPSQNYRSSSRNLGSIFRIKSFATAKTKRQESATDLSSALNELFIFSPGTNINRGTPSQSQKTVEGTRITRKNYFYNKLNKKNKSSSDDAGSSSLDRKAVDLSFDLDIYEGEDLFTGSGVTFEELIMSKNFRLPENFGSLLNEEVFLNRDSEVADEAIYYILAYLKKLQKVDVEPNRDNASSSQLFFSPIDTETEQVDINYTLLFKSLGCFGLDAKSSHILSSLLWESTNSGEILKGSQNIPAIQYQLTIRQLFHTLRTKVLVADMNPKASFVDTKDITHYKTLENIILTFRNFNTSQSGIMTKKELDIMLSLFSGVKLEATLGFSLTSTLFEKFLYQLDDDQFTYLNSLFLYKELFPYYKDFQRNDLEELPVDFVQDTFDRFVKSDCSQPLFLPHEKIIQHREKITGAILEAAESYTKAKAQVTGLNYYIFYHLFVDVREVLEKHCLQLFSEYLITNRSEYIGTAVTQFVGTPELNLQQFTHIMLANTYLMDFCNEFHRLTEAVYKACNALRARREQIMNIALQAANDEAVLEPQSTARGRRLSVRNTLIRATRTRRAKRLPESIKLAQAFDLYRTCFTSCSPVRKVPSL
eukprot:snap_masked-scaffold_2-processed-gene-23.39-mRNA-1 protein AED:1.00 eAED:1.00 QI:0/-1/0/0/-1/1/1/0/594